MGHGGSVIAELMADHREVEEMFEKVLALPPGDDGRRKLADEITIELVRHSVAEEQYLYPAVREHVPGGGPMADKELADHAEVERLLKELEGTDPAEDRFDEIIRKVVADVREHIADEEGTLFPALGDVCSADELNDLGDRIRAAKKLAPTRPHPGAPDTPPANKLLAPGAGLVDRARDLVTGRGRS
ncbi:hemerythrin domain-containing protein [Kitasatospora sp. NPDC127111]|uniref:hemerythrin domain-containing protein n=1 Tax=Kitasatospora sp. NPDC127111 TaxID=3345363 RepID=UPI0036303783